MQILAYAVLVLWTTTLLACAQNEPPHPDLPGLLALKATICGNCSELSSWTPQGAVCSSFDGVYCAWLQGVWRVVGVQLQLDAGVVSFNDSAMRPAGLLHSIRHLRELEVLCVRERPTPGPAPPTPPTPTNAPHQQQGQQQQQQKAALMQQLRQELQQQSAGAADSAAAYQGLTISRWLAAAGSTSAAAAAAAAHYPHVLQVPSSWAAVNINSGSSSSSSTGSSTDTGSLLKSGGYLAESNSHQRQQHAGVAAATAAAATGDLPYSWFEAFPHLTHLRVVGCGASGVLRGAAFTSSHHLTSLVLSHNRLTGSLPDEFVQLQALTVLDLSSNQLSGPLPVSWVGLQQLYYLYLNNNNLTGILPCEYSQLQLRLADLSGNHWQTPPIGDLGCDPHSFQPYTLHQAQKSVTPLPAPPVAAAAAAAAGLAPNRYSMPGWQAAGSLETGSFSRSILQQQQQQQYVTTTTSTASSSTPSSSSSVAFGQQVDSAAAGGVLTAPRCWLRRYCYDEGAFICLQRKHTAAAAGGCSSYVYGASDLHIDPLNQCDHGGPHLVGIVVMFAVFGAALLIIWLHHCRVVRWLHQPLSSSSSPHHYQQQQQQQPGPWQQRQWLISGPSPPSRARARSLGSGTGAAVLQGGGGSSSNNLKDSLVSKAPATLPLLYHNPTAEHEGAGYSSPVSSSSAADFIEAVTVGTPDALLPSALTTPSAGAISIRPQGPAGFNARGGGSTQGLGRRGSSNGDKGLGGRQGPSSAGSGRDASGYDSDASSTAGASGQDSNTVHLSGHWLKPGYYFRGNEPLPPWAGGVARLLAATLGPADSSGSSGSDGCFSAALMLPLSFLLLDTVTNIRLLLLWGVGPPPHVKLWPSYALLGLTCVPHLLVGAVVHFRLLAVACLPPALKASSAALISDDILPPGAQLLVRVYGWLFAAPAWLAYPVILVLLCPGVVLAALLCPLVLVMACCGLGSVRGVVRYIQLLQGCAALTQSAGSAVLLTVLFLMGNLPLEWAFLDSSLYYLTTCADLSNMAVAWWLRLQAVRRQQALALVALPAATGQRWT